MAMRVIVFGSKMMIRRLNASLAGGGIKVIGASDGLDRMMALLKQDKVALAVVDSLSEEAEAACRRINELWDIPLMLMVSEKRSNWEKLKLLDADGYIPEGAGKAELAARLQAVVRRCSPPDRLRKSTLK